MGEDTESSVLQDRLSPSYCVQKYGLTIRVIYPRYYQVTSYHHRCLLIWACNASRGLLPQHLASKNSPFYLLIWNMLACTALYQPLNTFINHFWPCLWFQSSARMTHLAWNKITPHVIPSFYDLIIFYLHAALCSSALVERSLLESLSLLHILLWAFIAQDSYPADKSWYMYIKYANNLAIWNKNSTST